MALLEPLTQAHDFPLSTPYHLCFKWDRFIDKLPFIKGRPFYAVAFRSKRKIISESATNELYEKDADAHEEAKKGGGLIRYWYGTLNERRECLATCLWKSREDAREAYNKPAHLKAMSLTASTFVHYSFERYWIWKSEDYWERDREEIEGEEFYEQHGLVFVRIQ